MKVVQFSQSDSPELPVRSNFLLGRIVRGQTVFSIRSIIYEKQCLVCSRLLAVDSNPNRALTFTDLLLEKCKENVYAYHTT